MNRTPIKDILATVSRNFDVSETEMKGRKRDARIMYARVVFTYIAYRAGHTWTEIGLVLDRNHSTVISQFENFNKEYLGEKYAKAKAIESSFR